MCLKKNEWALSITAGHSLGNFQKNQSLEAVRSPQIDLREENDMSKYGKFI